MVMAPPERKRIFFSTFGLLEAPIFAMRFSYLIYAPARSFVQRLWFPAFTVHHKEQKDPQEEIDRLRQVWSDFPF